MSENILNDEGRIVLPVLLAAFIVGGTIWATQGQLNTDPGNTDDLKKYYRIDFDVYFDQSNSDLVDNLYNKLTNDKATYLLKDPSLEIFRDDLADFGLIYVHGAILFTIDEDGQTVFDELNELLNNRIVSNSVVYAKVTLSENSHHYENPQPDITIGVIEINEASNLISYNYP